MDMTPMINVTFQLLIFFMLTNHLANPAPTLVPEAAHGRGVDAEGRQMIVIDEQGDYFLGDTIKPDARLVARRTRRRSAVERPRRRGPPRRNHQHKRTQERQIRSAAQTYKALGNVSNLGKVLIGVEEKP